MIELRHPVGEVIRLQSTFALGALVPAPTARIRRQADGKYYDGSIAVPLDPWVTAPTDNDMTELDQVGLPGVYFYDFPQARDTRGVSDYTVRMRSAFLSTQEDVLLRAGPLLSATEHGMCVLFGTILDPHGRPRPNVAAKVTIIPIALVPFATGISTIEVTATTDENGLFEVSLAQGLRVRLEIPEVGYDKRVVIPAASSADFTTL